MAMLQTCVWNIKKIKTGFTESQEGISRSCAGQPWIPSSCPGRVSGTLKFWIRIRNFVSGIPSWLCVCLFVLWAAVRSIHILAVVFFCTKGTLPTGGENNTEWEHQVLETVAMEKFIKNSKYWIINQRVVKNVSNFCANFTNNICYNCTFLAILWCFNDNCLAKKAYFRLFIILTLTIVPSFTDTECSLSPKLNKE